MQQPRSTPISGPRASMHYDPTDLGLDAAALPASGQAYSRWIPFAGWRRCTFRYSATQTHQAVIEVADDETGLRSGSAQATANTLTANSYRHIGNGGDPASGYLGEATAGVGFCAKFIRLRINNATASAGTVTAILDLSD